MTRAATCWVWASTVCDRADWSTQDWWDSVKNELEKPSFDKKRMSDMYDEMRSSLGDPNTDGHGMFRKRFIQVCVCLDSSALHNMHKAG